jgi:hypothetical protein
LISGRGCEALESSNFTATYFSVTFYPGNNSLMVGFDGVSYIEGKVPSGRSRESGPKSMGPADMGHIPMPGIEQGLRVFLYDLDANVRIVIKTLETNEKIACVEASLSNGKTVNLPNPWVQRTWGTYPCQESNKD